MSTRKTNSDIVRRIRALRTALGLSQEQLGKKLSPAVTRVAVVHWETGRSVPSAAACLSLAQLAKDTDRAAALWFWEQAGVEIQTLRALVPEFEKSFRQHEKRQSEHGNDTVRVPLLKSVNDLKKPLLNAEDIEEWIACDAALIPASARCLRVGKQWMSHPREGDILVLDVDRFMDPSRSSELGNFRGQLLAAQAIVDDRGLIASPRVASRNPMPGAASSVLPGISVGWLEIWQIVDLTKTFEARLLTGLHAHLVASKQQEDAEFEFYGGVQFLVPVLQWIRGARRTA